MYVFEPYLFGILNLQCKWGSKMHSSPPRGNFPDILDFLFYTFLRTPLKGKIENF